LPIPATALNSPHATKAGANSITDPGTDSATVQASDKAVSFGSKDALDDKASPYVLTDDSGNSDVTAPIKATGPGPNSSNVGDYLPDPPKP
jgi:hypothetical protein